MTIMLCLATVLIAVLIGWRYSGRLASYLQYLSQVFAKIPRGQWILLCICVGAMVRIFWVVAFPAKQISDASVYWTLAKSLAYQREYYIAGSYAFWPPGLPLLLVPSLLAFGSSPWIPLLNNLVLFAASILVVYALAAMVSDEGVARIATFLLVIWPNYIFYAGLVSKELILVVLLPLAIMFYLQAARSAGAWHRMLAALFAGLTLGYASLTQPSMLTFWSVFGIYEIIRRESFLIIFQRLMLVFIGMVLVISPWTMRNYLVLKAFVPVANNGGIVLYVGNNPFATGGHVTIDPDLDNYDEVTANQIAFHRAKEWIINNPTMFGVLAISKQILFLGDDSGGAYWTIKRGIGIDDMYYMLFKGISNLYWILIFALVLTSLVKKWRAILFNGSGLSILLFSFLYFFVLHSIFESGSRHHMAVMGCLAILAALPLEPSIHKPERSYMNTITEYSRSSTGKVLHDGL